MRSRGVGLLGDRIGETGDQTFQCVQMFVEFSKVDTNKEKREYETWFFNKNKTVIDRNLLIQAHIEIPDPESSILAVVG